MEARAIARHVRVAPRKAQQVIDMVRGMDVNYAVSLLGFSTKGAASVVKKLVSSAAANAQAVHKLSPDGLFIAEAYVNEGPTLKRIRPRAQGRAARINKRTSHITVVVRERATREA